MADQSHILKLKATLDTSDVQKKLNQLRNTQQNALKGSDKAGQNNINLGGLNSTLTRLNQTMMSMQRTLQQFITRNINTNTNINSSRSPFTPALPPFLRRPPNQVGHSNITYTPPSKPLRFGRMSPLPKGWTRTNQDTGIISVFDSTINPWFTPRVPPTWSKNPLYTTDYSFMPWGGGFPRMNFPSKLSNQQGAVTHNIPGYNIKNWKPHSNIKKPGPFSQLRGPLYGLFAGQAMDSFGNYLRSQGQTGAADATQLASGALTGAATGTMFGPAGIAIGAALGGLADAFQILTRRTTELTNAFENQKSRVSSAQDFDRNLKNKVQSETDSRRLAVGDKVYFKNRIKFKQGILNKLNKQQEEIGIGPGALSDYEQETLNKIAAFRMSSPTGELPEYIKRRQRLADRYKINVGTIDQVKSDIERYKGNLRSLGVYSEDEQELIDFKKRIPRDYTNTLETQRHVWQGDVDRLEKKKAYWEAYSEETGKPIDLKALEDLEKELNSYKDKIAAINDELNKREEILKEQKISWAQNDLNNLQDRLSNLKNPNMSNVNSLAQFGFGISKNDDAERLKMQTDYQKQQVDLQREIRDKVKELNTLQSATFS